MTSRACYQFGKTAMTGRLATGHSSFIQLITGHTDDISLCLTDLAVRVDIDALIIIAQQQLHPISVGQSDDGVRSHGALGVFRHVDVVHTEIVRIL